MERDLLYLLVGAPWAAVLIYGIRTVKDWPGVMERWNEGVRNKAEIESKRQRDRAEMDQALYERMDDRLTRVEKSEQECQEKLRNVLTRLATVEGFQVGRGEGHNEAQMILSSERQADTKKRKIDGD